MRAVDRSRAQPNAFARDLFDGLPGRYDALAEVLSFGQNHRWRGAMVDSVTASELANSAVTGARYDIDGGQQLLP